MKNRYWEKGVGSGMVSRRTARTIRIFSLSFTGFGLTRHQKVNFSTFDSKLEGNFITKWSQNLPFGPRPRELKLLFSILTFSSNHLKKTTNKSPPHPDLVPVRSRSGPNLVPIYSPQLPPAWPPIWPPILGWGPRNQLVS